LSRQAISLRRNVPVGRRSPAGRCRTIWPVANRLFGSMGLSSDPSYLAKKGASDMEADKFSRRVRNLEWAREYFRRAVHRGDTRRAFRAAALIERLEKLAGLSRTVRGGDLQGFLGRLRPPTPCSSVRHQCVFFLALHGAQLGRAYKIPPLIISSTAAASFAALRPRNQSTSIAFVTIERPACLRSARNASKNPANRRGERHVAVVARHNFGVVADGESQRVLEAFAGQQIRALTPSFP
jgi:hypothetical protein